MNQQLEINNAKKLKLDQARMAENSRMNPDTSFGLAVSSEVRAEARRVKINKELELKRKEISRSETDRKNAERMKMKKDAFDRVHTTVLKSKFDTLAESLILHDNPEDIKLAYQHCGGVISKLHDKKRTTVTAALIDEFAALFPSNDNSNEESKYGIGNTVEM